MFEKEDTTYRDMRAGSVESWLEATCESEDLVNRAGAKVTKEYIAELKAQIKKLEEKSALKDEFLRKLKAKVNNSSAQ